MQKPKVVDFGDAVHGVRLKGDPNEPEKAYFRVAFPGGDVDIVRTTNNDYWIHVRVNHPEDGSFIKGETQAAQLIDARLDIHGKHASEVDAGEFNDPGLYHLAVRIRRTE